LAGKQFASKGTIGQRGSSNCSRKGKYISVDIEYIFNNLQAGSGSAPPLSRSATPIPQQDTSEENSANDNVILKRCRVLISDVKELERKTLELWDAEISVILPEVSDSQESHAALCTWVDI